MITIAGLPELYWLGDVEGRASVSGTTLTMTAPPSSDWFIDPSGTSRESSAPALVVEPTGDFQLSARVSVEFGSTFDAGVLFVHQTNDDYAKLCFEYSPDGDPMVVSVVTRGVSDDANGPVIDGATVWLRISRTRSLYAFHHSLDGVSWRLTRAFALRDPEARAAVGLLAQSPQGESCTASFADITLRSTTLADLRDGT